VSCRTGHHETGTLRGAHDLLAKTVMTAGLLSLL